jgi:hypothetical protein
MNISSFDKGTILILAGLLTFGIYFKDDMVIAGTALFCFINAVIYYLKAMLTLEKHH